VSAGRIPHGLRDTSTVSMQPTCVVRTPLLQGLSAGFATPVDACEGLFKAEESELLESQAVVARLCCCWTSDTTGEQNKLCKPTPLSDVRDPRKILPKKENLDLNRYFIEAVAPARHVKHTVAAISPNQTGGKSQNCGFDIEANPQPPDGTKHRR